MANKRQEAEDRQKKGKPFISSKTKTVNGKKYCDFCWSENDVEDLTLWMHQMYEWAKRARVDIIRLETEAGYPPTAPGGGEPGDPPEPPWGFG